MHSGTRVGVGDNVQLAVDSKHNLIAEQQVHSKVSDLGLLAETATAARQNLAVDEIDAVTAATTRSRTWRTAKLGGSRPSCRSPIEAQPGAAATLPSPSSSTTPQPTPTVVRLASVWCPCIGAGRQDPRRDLGYQLR